MIELTFREFAYLVWLKKTNGKIYVRGVSQSKLGAIYSIFRRLKEKKLIEFEDISNLTEKTTWGYVGDIILINFKAKDFDIVDIGENRVFVEVKKQ